MKSGWAPEVLAIVRKEWISESRSKHGFFTALLFSVLTVTSAGFASFTERLAGNLAGGMLTIALLFMAVVALPRFLLTEDEQGTFDLLRLMARPEVIAGGKLIASALQMVVTGLALSVLYVGFAQVVVANWPLFLCAVLAESLALATGVTFCGGLVMGSANRWIMASVAALPILLPQMALSVAAIGAGLGSGRTTLGWQSVAGLLGYALALASLGPIILARVWTDE
jgi:heme exporter protein B